MTKITNERLAERVETKLRERAGFMRDAGHIDDAEIDEDAANLIQSLRAQGGVRVKPLEWTRGWMNAEAQTEIGQYIITYRRDGSFEWGIGILKGWASSWDEAKSAAQADYERRILSSLEASPAPVSEATHRHKKRGTEYVLIGIGKMQAEDWFDEQRRSCDETGVPIGDDGSVDMREVAIYRNATDPNEIWVRPLEEFNDGRFEALAAKGGQ